MIIPDGRMDLELPCSPVGEVRGRSGRCGCIHDLGDHIPHPNKPFSWPCSMCGCQEYSEAKSLIYILDPAKHSVTMKYVRVSGSTVIEGLTHR